jgi:hypothetical protein
MVAVAVAYAFALQMLLLAIGAPAAGAIGLAAPPICSSLGAGHSAPAGSGHDCLGACLAGCACSTPAAPAAAPAVIYLPSPGQSIVAAFAAIRISPFSATGANRSRAPPSA